MRDMQREDRRDFPKEDAWDCGKGQERQEALCLPELPEEAGDKRRDSEKNHVIVLSLSYASVAQPVKAQVS